MAMTVLIVDDSPTQLRLMKEAIKEGSYRVLTADCAKDAVDMMSKDRPDLILLDVVMPDVNGFQFCRKLKKNPDTKGIPIVLVTSKNMDSDRFWGRKQGADDYITKPYQPKELADVVRRYIG